MNGVSLLGLRVELAHGSSRRFGGVGRANARSQGRDRVVQGWIDGGFGSDAFGSLRCLITRANRQPAVANYVKRPGDPAHLPMALDVLRIQDGAVIDIVTFGQEVFAAFDLPRSI